MSGSVWLVAIMSWTSDDPSGSGTSTMPGREQAVMRPVAISKA